jgi:hypothetical protein
MGLRPIDSSDWLPDLIDETEYLRKRMLLADPTSGVFAALDDSLAGQQKILDEVRLVCPAAPGRSVTSVAEIDPEGRAHARLRDDSKGKRPPSSAMVPAPVDDGPLDCDVNERDAVSAPIVRASLLIPDDLCLMEERDGFYRLTAACVCAPSYWRLAEKIGRTLDGIHEPVPTLNEKLEAPMRQFFAHLPSNAVFERRNWLIHTDAELYQPVPDAWHRIQPNEVATLIVRSERQTLRRLDPTTIVFTIRATCHPLGDIASYREAARDLRDALEALDDAERAAKGYDYFASGVIDYLSRIS